MKAHPRTLQGSVILAFVLLALSIPAISQLANTEAVNPTVIPQIALHQGVLQERAGETVEMVFNLYPVAEGGDPLWSEVQQVSIGKDGKYSVLLGSATDAGLPQAVFAAGAARWLGVSIDRGPEQPRVPFASVAYAMKAADAQTLAGIPASEFVTRKQFNQFTGAGAQSGQPENALLQPNLNGTVTGSGTATTVPIWIGPLTQGNSDIVQLGTNIGINQATPSTTLDVGGTATFRGTTSLPALNTANTTYGFRSQMLDFTDSAWSTTTNAPVAQAWKLFAIQSYNNTANPLSTLDFMFQNGATNPASIVLSIGQTGVINFAPTQTFPGTITSVAATSPVTATTTSGAVSVGLNTTNLETTLNAVYPQLGAANTFVGSQSITGNLTASGTETVQGQGTFGANGTTVTGLSGTGTTAGVAGNSSGTATGAAGVNGYENGKTGQVYGVAGGTASTTNGAAGVIGNENAVTGAVFGVTGTTQSTTASAAGVEGNANATQGAVYGVAGYTASTTAGAAGTAGNETSTSGYVYGVSGSSQSPYGWGVYGSNSSPTGPAYGVGGYTSSASNYAAGVAGTSNSITGVGYGVWGLTNSTTSGAAGVFGNAGTTTGAVSGVSGWTQSSTNYATGVYGFEASATGMVSGVSGATNSTSNGASGLSGSENATSGAVFGVTGYTPSVTTGAAAVNGNEGATVGQVYGVYGSTQSSTFNAAGVAGFANATSGNAYGVIGNTSSTTGGAGVYGGAFATTGATTGVAGFSASTNGNGVSGNASAASGFANGVYGTSASFVGNGVFGTNSSTIGGNGVQGTTNSAAGNGVIGSNNAANGYAVGVTGITSSPGGAGVQGFPAAGVTSGGIGVIGTAPTSGIGVQGSIQVCGSTACTPAAGTAGLFTTGAGGTLLQGTVGPSNTTEFKVDASGNGFFGGNLNVTGVLTKGSGSFKIDHPLDPANKFLSHSFVESPDMMNVYNGNIVTDKRGQATVVLPDYFEALNRDFRYQLTVIGQFAQAIVAKEIDKNQFVIRTSKPGVKVSWQVTGIRQDAYANANRIPTEEDKPANEQGYYLHPEAFGQPASKSIMAAKSAMKSTAAGVNSR